ncbi:MAG TPA: Fe-S cluster assembly protein SufD [Terrimesophilobacter sp.]|nr:Fe-S cluster assembly protein SufD [Terrimesophilobacter sp.]
MSTVVTQPGQHGLVAHSDGPVVPIQTRNERPASFDAEDFGVPTGREVNWRFSPRDRLAPLFDATATDDQPGNPAVDFQIDAPEGVLGRSLGRGDSPRGEVFLPEDVTSAHAWSLCDEALYLAIPAGRELDDRVRVRMRGNGADRRSNAHIVIEARPNSKATVVLLHEGSAQFTENVELIVREGAHLTVVAVQDWTDDAIHASAHQARVDRDASLKHIVVSIGGGVVRLNPTVTLSGAGSSAELYGLSFADAGQHLENQVFLHHEGPNTRGDVLYKGALQGESARTVWIGDVLIGVGATGTNTYEANRNLVLTPGARADSIPNLEIETGQINGAGHASATGRFDDEQLFYLTSRGITELEARRLVVRGFLTEIVQKIDDVELRERLEAAIEEELRGEGVTGS